MVLACTSCAAWGCFSGCMPSRSRSIQRVSLRCTASACCAAAALGADAAGERSLARVRPRVRGEVDGLAEAFPAHGASVGFLSSVGQGVSLQVSTLREGFTQHTKLLLHGWMDGQSSSSLYVYKYNYILCTPKEKLKRNKRFLLYSILFILSFNCYYFSMFIFVFTYCCTVVLCILLWQCKRFFSHANKSLWIELKFELRLVVFCALTVWHQCRCRVTLWKMDSRFSDSRHTRCSSMPACLWLW